MSRILFVLSMVIFSTIGVFVTSVEVLPSVIAFFRAFFGALVLLGVILLSGKKLDRDKILKNARFLLPSGIALGFNWVLFFIGYEKTGVATATLCYYLAPAIVILLSPFLLKERPGKLKVLCAVVAFLGMIPVSGILSPDRQVNFSGVAVSVTAAFLYAIIVILNKKIKNLSGIETTVVQLGISSVVMAIYILTCERISFWEAIPGDFKTLLLLGVVHTGIAYLLYFSSIKKIKAADAALFSYIDPAGALILSYTVLGEPFTVWGGIGIVMIIGASVIAEVLGKKKR